MLYNEIMENKKFDYKTALSFTAGCFGHDIFFAALNGYMIMFITSQLFKGLPQSQSDWMIGTITLVMLIIRMAELVIDPMIGGLLDGINTKWGKFKPSILIGGLVGSLCLIFLFTDLGGLAVSNSFLYVCLFIAIYTLFDIVYSFKDIALWGMVPALSTDTKSREKIGTFARIGSTLGQALIAIIVVPLVLFFSQNKVETDTAVGDESGWLAFGIFVGACSFLGALILCLGAKEVDNPIRKNEKLTIKKLVTVLAKNDQLLWVVLSKTSFAIGAALIQAFNLYYFTYILGDTIHYPILGILALPIGFGALTLYPVFIKILKGRKAVFNSSITLFLVGVVLYFFADKNLVLAIIGASICNFAYPIAFLACMMVIVDTVEYGQLKTGVRSETATLSLRPLVDKMAGAVSGALVGFVAVLCKMTGDATATTVAENPNNPLTFKIFMFGLPALCLIFSIIIMKKVTLDEKKHQEIVRELEAQVK